MSDKNKFNIYSVLDDMIAGKDTEAPLRPGERKNIYTQTGMIPKIDPMPALRGREAGTSSRDKAGRPIGSKAHRAMNRRKQLESETVSPMGIMPTFGGK